MEGEIDVGKMKKENEAQEVESVEKSKETMANTQEVKKIENEQAAEQVEEFTDAETGEKLPFPEAAVVRIMKANMDKEKMIRKEVKVEMNKWLGRMCIAVSKEMNKFPYVMMGLNEFKEGIKVFENLELFKNEKARILAHLEAIKKDIERLEWDLGKRNEAFPGEGTETKPEAAKQEIVSAGDIE